MQHYRFDQILCYTVLLERRRDDDLLWDRAVEEELTRLCQEILQKVTLGPGARDFLTETLQSAPGSFRGEKRPESEPGESSALRGFLNHLTSEDYWGGALYWGGELLQGDYCSTVTTRLYSLPESSPELQLVWELHHNHEDPDRYERAHFWLEACWQANQRGLTPSAWLRHRLTTSEIHGRASEILEGISMAFDAGLSPETQEIYYALLLEDVRPVQALEAAQCLGIQTSPPSGTTVTGGTILL